MGGVMKMKLHWMAAVVTLALAISGCGPTGKVPSERERREAAQLASEAQFAVNLKDWSRAEKLYVQATSLHADGAYYLGLGAVRIRQGDRAGAKQAYESAIKSCEFDARQSPKDPEPWIRHAYLLAMLGRIDDGRALLEKAEKKFPDNRRLRTFRESRQFETMINSPGFKESAL
jgi:tetratricopeptide (TPR) repeat protein